MPIIYSMSSRTDWAKLRRNIPPRVQVANNKFYEVLWTDAFHPDTEQMGETRFDERLIVIKKGMGPKLTVETYFHELLHAFAMENNIELTETMVLSLESTFIYFNRAITTLNE